MSDTAVQTDSSTCSVRATVFSTRHDEGRLFIPVSNTLSTRNCEYSRAETGYSAEEPTPSTPEDRVR